MFGIKDLSRWTINGLFDLNGSVLKVIAMDQQGKKRNGKITPRQRSTMMEFLNSNRPLLSGKFSNQFTYKDAQKLWENLSSILNAIPGARKDWKQWRKTWQDMRAKTRAKKTAVTHHRQLTGGGEAVREEFTTIDEQILTLISPTAVAGHIDVQQSTADFQYKFEDMNVDNVEIVHEAHSPSIPIHEVTTNESAMEGGASFHNIDFDDLPSTSAAAAQKVTGVHVASKKKAKKRHVAVQRLTNSVEATKSLAEAITRKTNIKENYYKSKLEIFQQQVAAMSRMATALENLAEKK